MGRLPPEDEITGAEHHASRLVPLALSRYEAMPGRGTASQITQTPTASF